MDSESFTSLPRDIIIEKIGSYLLEDKNKTIHKIFYWNKDDNLQVLLLGEVRFNICKYL